MLSALGFSLLLRLPMSKWTKGLNPERQPILQLLAIGVYIFALNQSDNPMLFVNVTGLLWAIAIAFKAFKNKKRWW